VLEPGSDRQETQRQLRAIPGIGDWTASYIALRGLGDPDAFPGTDLGIRRALVALGVPDNPATITAVSQRWRPLRSYAAQYLWSATGNGTREQVPTSTTSGGTP